MRKLISLFLTLFILFSSSHAATKPVVYLYKDIESVSIALDEPSTGCSMQGIIVHPVERLTAKLVWFNMRICGSAHYEVSFISNELNAPDNIIHKGETFNVVPVNVQFIDVSQI